MAFSVVCHTSLKRILALAAGGDSLKRPAQGKFRVTVAVLPLASMTISVIVPPSISWIVNEVVGDWVTRSGLADVQLKSQV